LVVEGHTQAPICSDLREDWIRAPLSQDDLLARMATLQARSEVYRTPRIDADGVLQFGFGSVTVSPTETDLLEKLVNGFGELVAREALRACLPDGGNSGRNALDLHIRRLRRRIRPLGLCIRTAWGRGYLLNVDPSATLPTSPPNHDSATERIDGLMATPKGAVLTV
jgi:DNA-binding response OmpR family regulator